RYRPSSAGAVERPARKRGRRARPHAQRRLVRHLRREHGPGNIDAIVVGPGGLFTVEVKSHGGRISVENVNAAMLAQSYAQKKWLEGITGRQVTALLVFSRAYLIGRPVTRQRGVTVLPARMLAAHLQRYPAALGAEDAVSLHARLTAALEPLRAAA